MSLSKPWSHFGPHHPFPEKQKFSGYYQDALSSTLLPPLDFSISAAFSPGPDMSNSANMNALSPEEMERFQKLSNNYEPDVQVRSLIGVGLSALTSSGSAGLAQAVHSQYRDGLCQCRPDSCYKNKCTSVDESPKLILTLTGSRGHSPHDSYHEGRWELRLAR